MHEKIYRRLLKLYPAHFRGEYGEAMAQLFRDRMRTAGGPGGKLRVWLHILGDLAVSVIREHQRPTPAPAGPPNVFRLDRAGAGALMRRQVYGLLWSLLSAGVGALLAWAGRAPYGLVICFSVPAAAALLGAIRGRASARAQWSAFELVLEGDRLVQRDNRGTRAIARDEIVSMIEVPGYGLSILAANPRQSMFAPAQIGGYADLLNRLGAWRDIVRQPRPLLWGHGAASGVAALYLAAMFARSAWVVLPCAGICAVSLGWSFRRAGESRTARRIFAVLLAALSLRLAVLLPELLRLSR